MESDPRSPEVRAIVDSLIGTWEGRGRGGYPTIEPFEYRETTVITDRADHPALAYEQRTWRVGEEGEVPSHWESGFIRVSSDGTVRVTNAQQRSSEVMMGHWHETDSGWTIDLKSAGFTGDDRVVSTTRTFNITPGEMSYSMQMKLVATGELHTHLEANLTRV